MYLGMCMKDDNPDQGRSFKGDHYLCMRGLSFVIGRTDLTSFGYIS